MRTVVEKTVETINLETENTPPDGDSVMIRLLGTKPGVVP